MAQSPSDSVDFRLDAHRWEHRVLLVFASPDAPEPIEVQEQHFDGRDAGFRDRDLLLLTLQGSTDGRLRDAPGSEARPLAETASKRLYDRFDVPADSFRVILVGKDGTEKRRDAEPVTARSVFDNVGAMPVRQREIQEAEGG
jgi:hypothetical protein